jgi:hypothetical protein
MGENRIGDEVMIYKDTKLYIELLELLKVCSENIICPFCGNDLRKRYDCKMCEIDHMSQDCLREGKHVENCLLEKHAALVEIDIDCRKKVVKT